MRATRLLAAVLLCALSVPLAVEAQQRTVPLGEGQEIGVDAQEISYEEKTDTIVARGAVLIHRGEMELRADEVRLNRRTNQLEAHGNVEVTDPEGTITADAVRLDLDEETGFLENAQVKSRRMRYSLWGDRVEKGLGQSYHIENGRFTTCHCAEGAPSWSLSGRDLRVDLGGYGTLRGGQFKVLDVPIAYIPRAIFPVQQERQSGFLLPRFGFSNLRGFQTLLPWYWNISKSQDATVAFDLETSARAGLITEYRYALSRISRGDLTASYFNESFRGALPAQSLVTTVPQNRWSVMGEHEQELLSNGLAYADTFLVSDDLFLRDINTFAFEHTRDVALRTLPFTQSHVGILQLWNRAALKTDTTYYQNLAGPDSQTLQRVPEVTLWGQKQITEHLLGDLQAEAIDFQRSRGVGGLRFDLEPEAVLPLPLGRFAFGALHTSLRETAYHLTSQEVSQTGQVLPRDRLREIFELGAEAGTTLSRVYPFHFLGLEKLKHTIEPELTYLYIPPVGQEDLPLFDGTDRVNRRNLLTYGVVSRFLGKAAEGETEETAAHDPNAPDDAIRELGRLSLTQSVDLSRKIDPMEGGRPPNHFSDMDFAARVNPTRAFSLRFVTNYDAGNNEISAARVGAFIEDPRPVSPGHPQQLQTRTSFGVSYRVLQQNVLQELDDNAAIRLTDWAALLYSSRYDVVANRFLDNYVGLRLVSACDCWALDLAVTDRTNPQEVEVRAQLTLVGFGSERTQPRSAARP